MTKRYQAPKGNKFASKPDKDKQSVRRMINIRQADADTLDRHIAKEGTTWAKWSQAIIRQAISEIENTPPPKKNEDTTDISWV